MTDRLSLAARLKLAATDHKRVAALAFITKEALNHYVTKNRQDLSCHVLWCGMLLGVAPVLKAARKSGLSRKEILDSLLTSAEYLLEIVDKEDLR